MAKSNITEHPSTVLRREVAELKKRIDALEKNMNMTEQVMIEMVYKHNGMKDQLIKFATAISQLEAKKKKRLPKLV